MSIQPTSIILGSRLGSPPEESAVASLLQTASKVLDVVRRRWPLLVIPMLLVMLVSLSVGLTHPRRYYVTSTFERRNNLVIAKLIAANSPYSFAAMRQSLISDLRSFSLVGTVMEELKMLDHLPRDPAGQLLPEAKAMRDNLVGRWVDSIAVIIRETSDFSDIVQLRYLGETPEQAGPVLERLLDKYTALTRSKVSGVIDDAHAFFEQEARKCQEKVSSLRAELRQMDIEFPGTNPVGLDTVEQRIQNLSQSIEQLERERQRLQGSISAAETYLAELGTRPSQDAAQPNQPVAVDRSSQPNPQYQQMVTEIAGLNRKIEELKATRRMTDMHPEIVTLRRRIEVLQETMDKIPDRVEVPPGSAVVAADPWQAERRRAETEARTQRESLARVEREIRASLDERTSLKKQLPDLPERRDRYAKLQQALQNAQNDLDLWTNNMTQFKRILTAEAENRGIQIVNVDQPRLAGRLRTPTANGVFALSSGLGLTIAIIIVLIREILDRSVKDPARLKQRLGVPILETIGEIQVGHPPGWFLRKRVMPAFVTLQTIAVAAVGTLVYLALEHPETYDRVIARSAGLLGG